MFTFLILITSALVFGSAAGTWAILTRRLVFGWQFTDVVHFYQRERRLVTILEARDKSEAPRPREQIAS